MPRTLSPELQHDLRAALGILAETPDRDFAQFQAAISACSPILPRRFQRLIEDTDGGRLTAEDRAALEKVSLALEAEFAGVAPRGPAPQGRDARLMVYLSADEKAALTNRCEELRITQAEGVRRALAGWLK